MILKLILSFLLIHVNEEVEKENLVGSWERVCIESDALGFQISNCDYINLKLNFSEWNYLEMINKNGDRKFYDFKLDENKLNIFYDRYNNIIHDIKIIGDTLILESDEIYDGLLERKYYSNSQIKTNYQGLIKTGRGPNSTYKKIFDSIIGKLNNRNYFVFRYDEYFHNLNKRKKKKFANKSVESIIITLKSNQNLYPQLINKNLSRNKRMPITKDQDPFRNISLTNVKKVNYKNSDEKLSVNYKRVYFVRSN